MAEMSSRERVLKAFNHEEPDRVPIADIVHNIEMIEYYSGEKVTPKNAIDLTCRAIGKSMDMARHFGAPTFLEPQIVGDEDGFVYKKEWWTGQILERPFKTTKELSEIVKKDIERIYKAIEKAKLCPQATLHIQLTGEDFETPQELYEYFKMLIDKMDGSFLIASESLVGLHTAYYRAGMDLFVFLYDEDPQLVSNWLQALNDYEVFRINSIADPKLMPIAMVADDIAYNTGLLFSPKFLAKEWFPRAKRLIDLWHSHGCKVIFFCDGNKWPIMDNLINCGCDCIAPLEPASTMYVKDVKEKCPQITMAYVIDCSQLLPFGSQQEVEAEVKRVVDDGAKGGGLIIGSTSEIHPNVKLENVITMYETAKKYGGYAK